MFNVQACETLGRAVRCHQCSKSQEAAKVRMAFFKSLQLLRIVMLHHWVHGCSWLCALLRFLWSQQHVNSLIQSHTVWVAGDQRTNGMRIRHLELPINNEKHLVWLESLSLVGWKRRKHGERASTADKLGGSILEAVHWLPSLAEHFQPGTTRHSWRNSEINKYLSYCHIVSYDLPSFS